MRVRKTYKAMYRLIYTLLSLPLVGCPKSERSAEVERALDVSRSSPEERYIFVMLMLFGVGFPIGVVLVIAGLANHLTGDLSTALDVTIGPLSFCFLWMASMWPRSFGVDQDMRAWRKLKREGRESDYVPSRWARWAIPTDQDAIIPAVLAVVLWAVFIVGGYGDAIVAFMEHHG